MQGRLQLGIPPLTRWVKVILSVVFATFVLELITDNWTNISLYAWLSLAVDEWPVGSPWQVITYALVAPPVPASVTRVLIDLFFLWLILAPVESTLGGKNLITLSLSATVIGALSALLIGTSIASHQVLSGTQAMSLAGISALAMSIRSSEIALFGVFRMRPMHIVYITLGFIFLIFLASRDLVMLTSSVIATLWGIGFVKFIQRRHKPKEAKKGRSIKQSDVRINWDDFRVIQGGRSDSNKPVDPKDLN